MACRDTAVLDPGEPSGARLPVTAYVRIRPGPGQLRRIAELARQVPEVAERHRITGDDCCLLRRHAGGVRQLEAVLDRFLL